MNAAEPDFYRELTRRNSAFISSETQVALGRVRILIAGCGSTGGACIESLARVGVKHFALADSGSYELNNLNRQHAFLDDLGRNKAEFHADQVLRINPFAEVLREPHGITPENVERLADWADVIMDAVDVTTPSGIAMKLRLHEVAHAKRKPVFTALDMGFCQWGESFDYRDPAVAPVSARFGDRGLPQHPLKTLFTIVPITAIPTHCLRLVRDIFRDSAVPASQLGCTSDLLSAIIVPAVVRFVETGELVKGWRMDLHSLAASPAKRWREIFERPRLLLEIAWLMRTTP